MNGGEHRGKKRVRIDARLESLEGRRLLAIDFSIAAITDTQYSVENFPQNFIAQTQWIADNASDPAYNIKFVAHQGDLLRRGYSQYQAGNADAALKILDGKVPYTAGLGNHDYDNQFDDLDHHISSANFTSWFGDARYQAIPGSGFGGSSLDQRNRWHLFSAAGRTFMVMSLEWEAPDAAIAWAQDVIDAHRELPVIITTHEYLRGTLRTTSPLDPAGNSGQAIFDKLVKLNPEIFMVLSGHTGSLDSHVSQNVAGSAVYEIVADFEGRANGGNGWMQLVGFDLAGGTISLRNYSPVTGQWETGTTYSGIDFAGRLSFAPQGVPIANDDRLDLAPGASVTFDVRANDVDPDGAADLEAVTPGPLPEGVVQNPDGSFTYAPAAGFRGDVSFTYTVDDGWYVSDPATVTLRVNAAPFGSPDTVTTLESKSTTFNVAANDTDDAEDVAALRPILASLPPEGAVFVNADKSFTYTPDPRFVGTDTFSYYLSDGKTTSGPYPVTVNVIPRPPVYCYPISESTVAGMRTGSLAALQSTDGFEETIQEVPASGADLDQRWQFNIPGGSDVTLVINAKRSWGDDEFHPRYSTNGTNWYDLTPLVPSGSKDITRTRYEIAEPYQMWALPATLKGNVWIRATDTVNGPTSEGAETLTIDEMFIRCGSDTTPPGAPTGLSVTSMTSRSVSLSWPAATDNIGVALYDVYRIDSSGPVRIGTTSGRTFTATGLLPLTTYSFYAVARDIAGNVSSPGNTVTATTPALGAPNAPSSLAASVVKGRRIRLSWQDNSINENGFHVWSSPDGKAWSLIATLSPNTLTFTTAVLSRGTWWFRVTSYIKTVESGPSNTVNVLL